MFSDAEARCTTCHSLSPETVMVGPSLAGIATRAAGRVPGMSAEDYLYESILSPDDFKSPGFEEISMDPNVARRLTGEQLDDLVAFLLTLQ